MIEISHQITKGTASNGLVHFLAAALLKCGLFSDKCIITLCPFPTMSILSRLSCRDGASLKSSSPSQARALVKKPGHFRAFDLFTLSLKLGSSFCRALHARIINFGFETEKSSIELFKIRLDRARALSLFTSSLKKSSSSSLGSDPPLLSCCESVFKIYVKWFICQPAKCWWMNTVLHLSTNSPIHLNMPVWQVCKTDIIWLDFYIDSPVPQGYLLSRVAKVTTKRCDLLVKIWTKISCNLPFHRFLKHSFFWQCCKIAEPKFRFILVSTEFRFRSITNIQ